MANRTALFSRHQPGGVFTIDDLKEHPGDIFFVDSGAAGASDSVGHGKNPDEPFATLDYAIGQCTASNGDLIYLMPGHAETCDAAAEFAVDVIGVRIIGLGSGSLRPTFTFTATNATATITAASVWLENVLFVAGIDSVVAPLTISGADCTLKNIEFRDTTDIEFVAGVITTAAADRLTIDGLFYNGYTGGNACTIGVKLVGCNSGVIKNSIFHGLFSTGAIQMVTTACTNILIENCKFLNSGTAVTKDVVMGVAACTYQVVNCFDGVAGYKIEGSNVVPVSYYGPPMRCEYTKTTMPNNTAAACFNFIGAIELQEIFGVVMTGIQAQATAIKFQYQSSTEAAAVDLCATLDVNAFDAGSVIRATLDFSDAALGADDVASCEGEAYAVRPAIIYSLAATGAINIHSAAASTGAIKVIVKWLPLEQGAYLVSV